jgi:hypothetical protein
MPFPPGVYNFILIFSTLALSPASNAEDKCTAKGDLETREFHSHIFDKTANFLRPAITNQRTLPDVILLYLNDGRISLTSAPPFSIRGVEGRRTAKPFPA